ncbi:peptide-methionine (S)-S-oxide reductase, partial [Staphylococcus aureus]
VSTEAILTIFLENHDPTQGMRQGNDVGTQYRSEIWCTTTEQFMTATTVKGSYQANLLNAGYGAITTAISMANGVEFYRAEAEHQQYLGDNPFGYCPVHAAGVCLAGS